ncbi:MAG TPA: lysophospholipid acyltransferase family protein [Fimbriimonas sp.]
MKIGSLPVYYAVRTAFDLMFAVRGGLSVRGRENVPTGEGLLVVSNHMSHLDPPALACAVRQRRLLAMAKEELFQHPAFGWLIAKIGAFPIRRGEADLESVKLAMSYLEAGESMIVFPEGTRSDGVRMLHIERGVSMLAKKTGVKVLPVGINGTQVLMPRGAKGRWRHHVRVAIGPPFTYQEVATGRNERENREKFALEVQNRIIAQCRETGLDLQPPASLSEPAGVLDAPQNVLVPEDKP